MTIQPQTITSFFRNLIFSIGIILLVTGFISGLQFTGKTLFFPEYPINMYEDNCDQMFYEAKPLPPSAGTALEQGQGQTDAQRTACQGRLVKQRKLNQVNDFTHSLGFLISGIFLAILFRPKTENNKQ